MRRISGNYVEIRVNPDHFPQIYEVIKRTIQNNWYPSPVGADMESKRFRAPIESVWRESVDTFGFEDCYTDIRVWSTCLVTWIMLYRGRKLITKLKVLGAGVVTQSSIELIVEDGLQPMWMLEIRK